jgi:hypothetical protein
MTYASFAFKARSAQSKSGVSSIRDRRCCVTLACKGKDKAQRFLGTAQECSLAERSALGWARRDMHEERKRRTLLPGGPFKREIV